MNRDEIINLAEQAKINLAGTFSCSPERLLIKLHRLATLVAAAEREACAAAADMVADESGGVAEGTFATDFGKHTHMSMAVGAKNCAAAIRARSQQ